MKKILLLAAFAVVGVTVISCSSDDSGMENTSKRTTGFATGTESSKEGDSISVNDTLTTNQVVNPGPGDDIIVVPPPPTKP